MIPLDHLLSNATGRTWLSPRSGPVTSILPSGRPLLSMPTTKWLTSRYRFGNRMSPTYWILTAEVMDLCVRPMHRSLRRVLAMLGGANTQTVRIRRFALRSAAAQRKGSTIAGYSERGPAVASRWVEGLWRHRKPYATATGRLWFLAMESAQPSRVSNGKDCWNAPPTHSGLPIFLLQPQPPYPLIGFLLHLQMGWPGTRTFTHTRVTALAGPGHDSADGLSQSGTQGPRPPLATC